MAFPDNLRSLGELRSRCRRARRGGQAAGVAFVFQGGGSLSAPQVGILPAPRSQTTSPVDFRDTSRLIDQGHQLTTRWLASQRAERPAPPDLPAVRVAEAS